MAGIVRNGRISDETVMTIGFFDGVHLGHRHLIGMVVEEARRRGMKSAVLTFDRHPREVLGSDFRPKLITTRVEKEMVMEGIEGLDYCVMEGFTQETAGMSAREFMGMMRERYGMRVLMVGYDHRFGRGRSETMGDYARYGMEMGVEVIGADAEEAKGEGGREISSTLIRRCIEEGRIEEANRCLGREYFVAGKVVEGYRLGRTIGFPTANIEVGEEKLLPGDGVYGVRVRVRGRVFGGMLYIGERPTVNTGARSVEANIFDFEGDIYGEEVVAEFVGRIRGGMKFDGVEELRRRLEMDRGAAKEMTGG